MAKKKNSAQSENEHLTAAIEALENLFTESVHHYTATAHAALMELKALQMAESFEN